MLRKIALCALTLCTLSTFAAQDVVSAVSGSVKSIDKATKVVVVDTKDGTEHTFHYTEKLAVHTGADTGKAAKKTLLGIHKGSMIAVHYTAAGGREIAHEIDVVGDDGLKAIKGTVKGIDHGARTISIDTEKGTVETLHLTGDAAKEAARETAKGTDKTAKVTAYYTDVAGKKTVHFVEEAF